MGNKNKSDIIRIYGVTLADENCRTDSYSHGATKLEIDGKECYVQYVGYSIEHLISTIIQQGLKKKIIKRLEEENE